MTTQAAISSVPSGWRSALLETLAATRAAVLRFPLSALLLLLAALYANLLAADVRVFPNDALAPARSDDLIVALIAAALAALSGKLFVESRFQSGWRAVLVPFACGLAAFAVMWPGITGVTTEWAFMMALIGVVPLAPFVGRGTSAAFWMFAAHLVFAALLALLALGLFGGGISAILASLTHLFGIDIPGDLYEHVWLSIGLFVAPLFGMGQTPRDFSVEPGRHESDFMQRGMRALGDFAAVPLLIVYAVILHLYALKIVLTRSVPDGQIGWLVLTYGFCIFAVLILTRPFLDTARAPSRFFVRFWPLLLPIPLALLAYALVLRVGAFGITVDRFLLGLFGAVSALLVLAQLWPRLRGDTRVIAGLPVLALLLGSFGPQGALSRSVADQSARFLAIVNNPPVEGEDHDRALSALLFLSGERSLQSVAPEGFDVTAPGRSYRDVAVAWGLDPDRARKQPDDTVVVNSSEPMALVVAGFDTVLLNAQLYPAGGETSRIDLPDGARLSLSLQENVIGLGIDDEPVTRFPVSDEQVAEMVEQGRGATLTLTADGRTIMLAPTYFHAELKPGSQIRNISGTIFIRRAEWR
ncbi:DUF4153 domain-containing protein [Nitratireductor pacificus]|uniref:DUF4153 domain-containing protein n=1 Tax=Nitratireductor pacificus pht-3B TaxID=391937 RepID=K2M4H5_9HYPH|nr:DUF4153 domain-containing protein [Nitratireductor pacificus]EKF16966.1 hypothetical protein NA2_20280 [Nitratireductor pacificus pht-3B]